MKASSEANEEWGEATGRPFYATGPEFPYDPAESGPGEYWPEESARPRWRDRLMSLLGRRDRSFVSPAGQFRDRSEPLRFTGPELHDDDFEDPDDLA